MNSSFNFCGVESHTDEAFIIVILSDFFLISVTWTKYMYEWVNVETKKSKLPMEISNHKVGF